MPKKNLQTYWKKQKQQYRAANPIRSAYQTLKDNAKRRGKEFNISLQEWLDFMLKTDYIKYKGRDKNSASIDRIDPDRGYSIDNIRILTFSQNSSRKVIVNGNFVEDLETCPF